MCSHMSPLENFCLFPSLCYELKYDLDSQQTHSCHRQDAASQNVVLLLLTHRGAIRDSGQVRRAY